MSKTFACRDLGGTCDAQFSGETVMEIMQKAGPHMMSDDAHKASVMSLETRTGETKDQWMVQIQSEFDAKPQDV
jgi:predicted small metal-binding protein